MSDLITKSITVHKSPAELYRIWSNFEQFPNFMQHIKSIRDTGGWPQPLGHGWSRGHQPGVGCTGHRDGAEQAHRLAQHRRR